MAFEFLKTRKMFGQKPTEPVDTSKRGFVFAATISAGLIAFDVYEKFLTAVPQLGGDPALKVDLDKLSLNMKIIDTNFKDIKNNYGLEARMLASHSALLTKWESLTVDMKNFPLENKDKDLKKISESLRTLNKRAVQLMSDIEQFKKTGDHLTDM